MTKVVQMTKVAFYDFLRVNDSTGRNLLNVFSKRSKEVGLNLPDCGDQCHYNGANLKGKEAVLS